MGSFGNVPVNKIRHYVLDILLGLLNVSLCIEPVNKIRHFVLDDSIALLGVYLVLYQWFNQTLCVKYFTEMISGSFDNRPVNKIRHCVFSILIGLFMDSNLTNH